MMVTVPSGAMETKVLSLASPSGWAMPLGTSEKPISRPPPAARPVRRKVRLEVSMSSMILSLHLARGLLDGLADAHVGGAAADVPRHRRVDVGVRGPGLVLQQGRGRHDLA